MPKHRQLAMAYRKNPVSTEELRRLAQQRIAGHVANPGATLTATEIQHLFEELQIHQVELEMQNEHLNATRAQLETALTQSSELYDFSPVGSLLLDQTGAISKLNLAAAQLLQGERARLLGGRLGLYVPESERAVFNGLLERARVSAEVQSGELPLVVSGLLSAHVQVKVAALPHTLGWQVILVDITERKKTEERLHASEERWKLALEAVGDGVWDWNVQTGAAVYSRRLEQLYGFAEGEFGHQLEDSSSRIHPQDRARAVAALQAYLTGQRASYSNEHRGCCKDGSWKWVLSRGAIVSRTEDGKPVRMIGTHVDITANKQAEEALRAAARFQEAVFDSLSAHLVVLDHQGIIVQTNAAWRKYAADNDFANGPDFSGGKYLDVLACITEDDTGVLLAATTGIAAVACGEVSDFQLQYPFFAPADKRWFTMKVTPVHDAEQRIVISHEDVSNLKAAELASWKLANIDTLTSALSRRNLFNLAEQELARSRRYDLPLMVLMLDLDHFKLINDQYGHAVGDTVLQAFVQTVSGVLRESDLIGRVGGEEFAVLLPNTTQEGGCALAQRIIDSVRSSPVAVGDKLIPYTVSIGAGCLSGEITFSALLDLADTALYRAKHGGRDRLEVGLA